MKNSRGISIKDVSYVTNGTGILKDINLDAAPGEFIGVIGPNGAGKSTLARLIVNTLKPTSGRIVLDGVETKQINTKLLYRKIAFIPQNLDFSFPFTVLDTVLMGRMPYLARFEYEKDHDYELALDALDTVGMKGFTSRKVTSLSGGEKQLVALARAIVQQTDYLVLDEPISNLDINHQIKIMSHLKDMTLTGKGLMVVLHDLGFASRYCDKIVVLNRGEMVNFDTPEKVLTKKMISDVFKVEADVWRSESSGLLMVDPVRPVE